MKWYSKNTNNSVVQLYRYIYQRDIHDIFRKPFGHNLMEKCKYLNDVLLVKISIEVVQNRMQQKDFVNTAMNIAVLEEQRISFILS